MAEPHGDDRTEPAGTADSGAGGRPVAAAAGWSRVVVLVGAALALLLLGAAGGLLVNITDTDRAAPAPDSPDVGFCQDMTVHHRQAVLMAGLARSRGEDQRIRTLAFDVETSQLEQIGRMQGWLHLWGRDRLPIGGYMAWMSDEGHAHAGIDGTEGTAVKQMPGMASPAELDRLRSLSGREFDVLFLQLMLRHHQGGVPMADEAIRRADVGVVRNLADKIVDAQTAESEYMRDLLTEFGAAPLPDPN